MKAAVLIVEQPLCSFLYCSCAITIIVSLELSSKFREAVEHHHWTTCKYTTNMNIPKDLSPALLHLSLSLHDPLTWPKKLRQRRAAGAHLRALSSMHTPVVWLVCLVFFFFFFFGQGSTSVLYGVPSSCFSLVEMHLLQVHLVSKIKPLMCRVFLFILQLSLDLLFPSSYLLNSISPRITSIIVPLPCWESFSGKIMIQTIGWFSEASVKSGCSSCHSSVRHLIDSFSSFCWNSLTENRMHTTIRSTRLRVAKTFHFRKLVCNSKTHVKQYQKTSWSDKHLTNSATISPSHEYQPRTIYQVLLRLYPLIYHTDLYQLNSLDSAHT